MKTKRSDSDIYIIRIEGDAYSEKVASRCLTSCNDHMIGSFGVEYFNAVTPKDFKELGDAYHYTYPIKGTKYIEVLGPEPIDPKFFSIEELQKQNDFVERHHLELKAYRAADYRKVWGASMSHFRLWETCFNLNKPIMILEHDTVFMHKFNFASIQERIVDGDIVMINDPRGCTRRGQKYHENILSKGFGIHDIDGVNEPHEHDPDGLAGGSAYIITPKAAKRAIGLGNIFGVWPNDALLCKQLFHGNGTRLRSFYPYLTKPLQSQSTTTG